MHLKFQQKTYKPDVNKSNLAANVYKKSELLHSGE
jgi:hypothetical protein